jgi:alpha-L-rhamnosidase
MTGKGMNSHNHAMMGSVGAWFYKAIAGINLYLEEEAGFSWFSIRPHIVGDLTFAHAATMTVRGRIESSWEKVDGRISMKVVVPVGSQARVSVPKLSKRGGTIAEGETILWQDGVLVGRTAGIYDALDEKEYVTFSVGSGEYHFENNQNII